MASHVSYFLGLLLVVMPQPTVPQTPEPGLDRGVRLITEGDFESGLLELDAAARELAAAPSRAKDAARAYLYLGVGYLGLGQPSIADAKFRQALVKDPDLRLGELDFSPKVIRAFEANRERLRTHSTLVKEARKKRGKRPYLLAGAGAVGGLGAAAYISSGSRQANRAPTASISVEPEGEALLDTTLLTFSATASDPDGDPLFLAWDFGDGTSAAGLHTTSGAGVDTVQVYRQPGEFRVTLTVEDHLDRTQATSSVRVRAITGQWGVAGLPQGPPSVSFTQDASNFSVATDLGAGFEICGNNGRLYSPRRVEFEIVTCLASHQGGFRIVFKGEADPGLQGITGTWTSVSDRGVEVHTVTLTRE